MHTLSFSMCLFTIPSVLQNNSTQTLAGPSKKDSNSTYSGGVTAIVQLTSAGAVSYIPYNQNDSTALSSAQWSPVGPIAAVAPKGIVATGTSSSTRSSTNSNGPSPTGTKASQANADCPSRHFSAGSMAAFTLVTTAFVLLHY
jgi:hypothetical protein